MRKCSGKILAAVLTGFALASAVSAGTLAAQEGNRPAMGDVRRIQAYTDETVYGTGLVKVEVTYNNGVSLTGINADSYILEDRGTLSPDYGKVKIAKAVVDGQVVTLTMDKGTAAAENNALIYTGESAQGSRVRNAFGVYCTGAWYRDENGAIHFDSGDADKGYLANTTGMGYQARACLELKLRHAWEEPSAAVCLAGAAAGRYKDGGPWARTIDLQFGENGFRSFEQAGIRVSSTAGRASDGTGDDYVRGYFYVPEHYDPAAGIVFTLQGQGISYWKLADGCDNDGTGIMYDSATTSWIDKGAIVVNIHDRSSAGPGKYYDIYDFVADDVNVMKYFIDAYGVTGNVVLQGNSRGTMASALIIKALAGQPYHPQNQKNGNNVQETYGLPAGAYNFTIDSYICQNGTFGYGYDDADWAAVAETGLKVWAFDGEQDTDNIGSIAKYKALMTSLKGADWAAENVRLTGYPSELYAYWGESDHSTTRLNAWYFSDSAFYGPDFRIDPATGKLTWHTKLNDGASYELKCRGKASGSSKEGYRYTIYDDLYQEWALKGAPVQETTAVPTVYSAAVTDFDSITDLKKDFSQAAQLPLTGCFMKNIDVNGNGIADDARTAGVYIAPEASIRSYFTVVAVPDGVNTWDFLKKEGWLDLADQKGEGLFILEPGAGGWSSPAEETGYLKAAAAFLTGGNNIHSQNVFSTFGEFYLAGYGKGAAALEYWAAANPTLVISQVYLNGESSGSSALMAVAGTEYDGKSANGDMTDVLDETLKQTGLGGGRRIAPKDVPVPTYLAGYTGSESYWQEANDCLSAPVNGVYYQDISSDAYQTEYANKKQKDAGAVYGISKVKVSGSSALRADEIYAFLSEYTRYDTTFAYSNAIAQRLDYTSARVAAQRDAKDGQPKQTLSNGTQIWAVEDAVIRGHGTVQVGVIAFSDNSGDGKWDPREYLLYIPEGFEGKKLPVLVVYPGNTQTDSIFMDSTLWWQTAEEEGIALAFVCETYNASPSSVSHADSDLFYHSLITLLKEKIDGKYADLDFSRIYGTGQSAGSNATQGFAITNPEFFAAVGSTSAAPVPENAANKPIPTMMITGQMDVSDLAKGFGSESLRGWAEYMLGVNGFGSAFAPGMETEVVTVDSRHPALYRWSRNIEGTDVPLVQWAQCLLRPHNCYPSDIPILWDFVKHFSFTSDSNCTITRYYSESAFEKDDAIVISVTAADS